MFDSRRSKWDAWKALKGTSKEDAKRSYVEAVQQVSRPCGSRPVTALMIQLLVRDDSQESKNLLAELRGRSISCQ
jgi:hypothetical protein